MAVGWPKAEWAADPAGVYPAAETVAAVVAEQVVSASAAPGVLGQPRYPASGRPGPRSREGRCYRWPAPVGRPAAHPAGVLMAGTPQVAVGVG
ncbi:hypothetical protein, partial [Mycobacterium persicum]|uniref:hypothetical protein n=1 Tax=Mycobacterium persicum TaxID=1487726 RepID=UPI001C80871B